MQTTPHGAAATDGGRGNIALVRAFFDAFQAKDLERAMDMMSEDIVYQNVPFPADRGKASVRRTLAAFGYFVTGFEVRWHNIAERDGVVLTERTDIMTGPLVYIDLPVCGTFELRDGRITVWRDYFDLAGATAKLLVSPIRSLVMRARARRS
jgi:limonene-1,2-epoxide hydrolase